MSVVDDDIEGEVLSNHTFRNNDTSFEEYRNGKDIQGIPWRSLNLNREKVRLDRIEHYKNHESIPNSGKDAEKECIPTMKDGTYYEFQQHRSSIKPTIQYCEFRNLVWATSKHDVYLLSEYSLLHYSALTCTKSEMLNFQRAIAPVEKNPGNFFKGLTKVKKPSVSTLAIKDTLLVAGGSQGELIGKYLDKPGIRFGSTVMPDVNAIITSIEICNSPSGAVHFTASNKDGEVRDFDVETFQISNILHFPWEVNHTSLSPDRKLLVVVGDSQDGRLVDWQSGETVKTFHGHLDYSYASAWHPDGQTFATGNQDKTCRLWDTRNLSKSVTVLKGNIGAITSIRFTSDGQFMAMTETADFVHIYDVKCKYEKEQEIDFMGETAGISFSPDTESLFIAVLYPTYSGLLQYRRRRDSLIWQCISTR